jgi:hypothetical protein
MLLDRVSGTTRKVIQLKTGYLLASFCKMCVQDHWPHAMTSRLIGGATNIKPMEKRKELLGIGLLVSSDDSTLMVDNRSGSNTSGCEIFGSLVMLL